MTVSDHLAPQALASLELFQDLPSAALDDVLTSARVWRLPRETRIFNQGDAGRAHALIEGSIRISQSGSDGAQIVMRFIAPGEMFGTVALFTDGRYPADAITLTASGGKLERSRAVCSDGPPSPNCDQCHPCHR